MTEAEWLACVDPSPLEGFLRSKGGERKHRLFAVACCRSIWRVLLREQNRNAVEITERYVDGEVDRQTLVAAWHGDPLFVAKPDAPPETVDVHSPRLYPAASAGHCAASPNPFEAAGQAAAAAAYAALAATPTGDTDDHYTSPIWLQARAAEKERQCAFLRDIFAPFLSVTLNPSWLAWNGCVVGRLAQAAYQARTLPDGTLDSARLSTLAGALEEAGCTDAAILGHLRGPGPHVRGCWVVDLLLGKQ